MTRPVSHSERAMSSHATPSELHQRCSQLSGPGAAGVGARVGGWVVRCALAALRSPRCARWPRAGARSLSRSPSGTPRGYPHPRVPRPDGNAAEGSCTGFEVATTQAQQPYIGIWVGQSLLRPTRVINITGMHTVATKQCLSHPYTYEGVKRVVGDTGGRRERRQALPTTSLRSVYERGAWRPQPEGTSLSLGSPRFEGTASKAVPLRSGSESTRPRSPSLGLLVGSAGALPPRRG